MAAVRFYQDLTVWQRGIDLVSEVYRLSERFPREEQFGLTNQLRRSAVSIPANIAEGHGRLHKAEFVHFLSIARGSLSETETHLVIAVRLGFLPREEAQRAGDLVQEVGRLLNGLINSLHNGNGTKQQLLEEREGYELEWYPGSEN
jgi:four helix bundle protein